QVGTRIDTDPDSGAVTDIRSNIRLVLPHTGCLRCNKLILGWRLQDESRDKVERERNRYADEVPAASVITFNTMAAGQAMNDFMLMMGELMNARAPIDYLRVRPLERKMEPVGTLTNQPGCRDCGITPGSRRARGDAIDLPLAERS